MQSVFAFKQQYKTTVTTDNDVQFNIFFYFLFKIKFTCGLLEVLIACIYRMEIMFRNMYIVIGATVAVIR